MSKGKVLLAAAFILPGLMLASCADKKEILQINKGIAARIGDKKITDDEVDAIFELLPDNKKDDFKGLRGRAEFVEMVINDELMYKAAQSGNLKNDKNISKQLEDSRRRILISAYYSKTILGKIEISNKEVEEYFKANELRYINLALYKAQHIFSTDSMKCVEWKRRVEEGEKFSAIAKGESEDASTSEAYGNLGYFNSGGYVKFIGRSKAFTDALEFLEIGVVSDVIKHEQGFSIVRLNDKKPETIKPISEVRKSIIDILRQARASEMIDIEIDKLRKKYKPVNYVQKAVIESTRTPEQLWEIAQAEDASYTRILYFRELVNRYPDHKFAPQALFMIGFIYGEELQDRTQAGRTYRELLREYPDSEIAESSKWMIDNLDKPHPKFESIENVQQHIEMEKE